MKEGTLEEVTTFSALKSHLREKDGTRGMNGSRTLCGEARVVTEAELNKHHRGPRQAPVVVASLPMCERCYSK